MATVITGKLRDVWMNGKEPVLVIGHPKVNGKVIREHLNVRQRDILKDASVGELKINDFVSIKCDLSQYAHNGEHKACAINITSIKRSAM
jgi:hypothetical protein